MHLGEFQHRHPYAEVAEVDAERDGGEALQHEQHAAGGEQLVDRRRREQGRDDKQMQQRAQPRDQQDGEGGGHVIGQPEHLDQVVHAVHADHDQFGVADPGDVDDAEDQVQPERQQRQHAAEQDAVHHGFEQVDVENIGHRFTCSSSKVIPLPSSPRNGFAVIAGGTRRLRRASKDAPPAQAAILRDAAQARGSSATTAKPLRMTAAYAAHAKPPDRLAGSNRSPASPASCRRRGSIRPPADRRDRPPSAPAARSARRSAR